MCVRVLSDYASLSRARVPGGAERVWSYFFTVYGMESSRCCRRGRAPLPVILMCFPAIPVYETARKYWLLLAPCVVLRLQTVDRNLTRLC